MTGQRPETIVGNTISFWSAPYQEYDNQHLLKLGNCKLPLKNSFKQNMAKQSQTIRYKSEFQAMLLKLPDIYPMTSNSVAPETAIQGPQKSF